MVEIIGGIVNKIEANADKIGFLLAFFSDPMAAGRGIEGALPFVIDRVTQWKLPNLKHTLWYLTKHPPYRDPLTFGIGAYLLGEMLGGKYGNLSKDIGSGLIKGTVVASLVLLPAMNPHGNPGSGSSSANPFEGVYGK